MCYLYDGNEPIVDKLMRHKNINKTLFCQKLLSETAQNKEDQSCLEESEKDGIKIHPLKPSQILDSPPLKKMKW